MLSLVLWTDAAVAQPARPARPILIENIEIRAMDGSPARIGAILIRGSRIDGVGENVERPRFARRIDGTGLVATPGLIDVQSVLGMTDLGASGGDATAIAADSFDRYDTAALEDALRHGVTMIHLAPVGRAGVSGRSSIIRLSRDGERAIGAVHRDVAALCIDLESPAAALDRLQLFDRIRRQFRAAEQYKEALEIYEEELAEYEKKLAEAAGDGDKNKKKDEGRNGNSEEKPEEKDGPKPESAAGPRAGDETSMDQTDTQVPPRRRPGRPPRPDRGGSSEGGAAEKSDDEGPTKPERPAPNRSHDVLLEAIAQKLPVRIRAQRSEDILNALELAEEYSLRVILDGAAEAHLVAGAIAERSVPVVIEPAAPGRANPPDYLRRRAPEQASVLAEHDVEWVSGSGGVEPRASRFTLLRAQSIVQQSAVNRDPLEIVTANAAELLRVGEEYGKLAPDMLADLVLWTGDPLNPTSRVIRVYVGGQEVLYRDAAETTEGDQ